MMERKSLFLGCYNTCHRHFKTKQIITLLAAFALTATKVASAFQPSLPLLQGQNNVLQGTDHCIGCNKQRFGNQYRLTSSSLHAIPSAALQSNSLFRKATLSADGDRKWSIGTRNIHSGFSLQSSTMPHADIAVRLDQPILAPTQSHFQKNVATMLKSILTIFLSDIAKTALIAFFLAFTVTLLSKSSSLSKNIFNPFFSSIKHVFKLVQGQIQKVKDGVVPNMEKEGIPMTFDKVDDGSLGWGVCTLSSKTKLGRSQYMQYDFKLPNEENILNLALGQKVSLCCLDDQDRVAKKDYYLFSPKSKKGSFSIVASSDGFEDDDVKLGKGEGDFRRVLANELEIGDEVALQPGPRTLSYKGEYLPVTDMVYIASGSGIAPVLDQVKAVLPTGSSSVKSVTVIWLNGKEEDFDVALSPLEDEYFKYSTKLAVSCIVDEKNGEKIAQNKEVDEALPPFEPGTMAVIAGPKRFGNDAKSLLMGNGYPEECICVLP